MRERYNMVKTGIGFGTALAIWDRWAGTIYLASGEPVTDFGIGVETQQFHSLAAIYLCPLQRVAGRLWTARKADAEGSANG